MTWDAVKVILRAAKESTDVNPIVKSAVGGVVFLMDSLEAIKEVEEDYKHLKGLVTEFAEAIHEAMRKEQYGLRLPPDSVRRGDSLLPGVSAPDTAAPSISTAGTAANSRISSNAMPKEAERALSDLKQILYDINIYLKRLSRRRDSSDANAKPARCACYDYCRRTLLQLLTRYRDQGNLRKLERDFKEALERFKFLSDIRTLRVLRKTHRKVADMKNAQEQSSGEMLSALKALSARLAGRLRSLSAGQPGHQFSAEELRQIIQQAIQEAVSERSSASASEASARLDALEKHVVGFDGRLKDTISEAQKHYTTEQALVLESISDANRGWERKRQEERAADRQELDVVKESMSRIKAHIDAIEAQEGVDLVKLFELVENINHKVDNMHASESERNKSHAETTQLLADLRKHINATAQAAAAPLDLPRTGAGETALETATRPEERRARGNETRNAPARPPAQPTGASLAPASDKGNAATHRDTHRAPLRRQTHPNPRQQPLAQI